MAWKYRLPFLYGAGQRSPAFVVRMQVSGMRGLHTPPLSATRAAGRDSVISSAPRDAVSSSSGRDPVTTSGGVA
jgi:hypothetical protein